MVSSGLDLVAKMLIDKGDVIVTENPTFLGALIAFNPCEPRYAAVQIDDEGMDMEDLERTLKQNPGAKLIYTVSDFQNPTGVTMGLERCKQGLIELCQPLRLDRAGRQPLPRNPLSGGASSTDQEVSDDTEGRVLSGSTSR